MAEKSIRNPRITAAALQHVGTFFDCIGGFGSGKSWFVWQFWGVLQSKSLLLIGAAGTATSACVRGLTALLGRFGVAPCWRWSKWVNGFGVNLPRYHEIAAARRYHPVRGDSRHGDGSQHRLCIRASSPSADRWCGWWVWEEKEAIFGRERHNMISIVSGVSFSVCENFKLKASSTTMAGMREMMWWRWCRF